MAIAEHEAAKKVDEGILRLQFLKCRANSAYDPYQFLNHLIFCCSQSFATRHNRVPWYTPWPVVDAAGYGTPESAPPPSLFHILKNVPIPSNLLPVEKQGAMVMRMDTAVLFPDPDIGRIKTLTFILFDDIGHAGRDIFIA